MKVELLYHSPLWLAANAIRMSRNNDNHDKSDSLQINNDASKCTCPRCGELLRKDYDEVIGIELWCDKCSKQLNTNFCFNENNHIGYKDKVLIARVGNKLKHKSVLEQVVYWFEINSISRACLQELARHRTARLTVKSTRYTLKELKNEKPICKFDKRTMQIIDCDMELAKKYLVFTGIQHIDLESVFALGRLQLTLMLNLPNDKVKYTLPESFKTRLQYQIDGRNLQNFLELRTSKEALWEIRELALKIFNALPDNHKYLYKEYVNEKTKEVGDGDNKTTTLQQNG